MECTSIYQHVIISMDAVLHGLLYGESNACPDAHVVIATNAMFVVGGDVQRTGTAKDQLSFTEETGFHVLAAGRGVGSSVREGVRRVVG